MKPAFDRLLCLIGAATFLAAALFLRLRMIRLEAPQWALPSALLAGLGALSLIAALLRSGWYQRAVAGLMKMGVATVITFALAEAACRAARVDFNELLGMRRANEAFPIYFRMPTHPSGEVFFTRTPGASWTGKPLQTLLQNHRSTDLAYTEEKELTLTYSKEGFRNPDALTDWDIAVLGDSFTESGYLPETEIFTGIAASRLGRRIKNLGITDTGNFAHIHYLETYASAPSCKSVVLAFFEGNDLTDNVKEMEQIAHFQATGERPSHDIPVQTSLLKTLWTLARDFKKLRLQARSYANATYQAAGQEIPVTIADAPPSSHQMNLREREALSTALDRYAQAARQLGMTPHLLYLPCKRRVLHDHLQHGADYPEPDWQPGDLPQHLEAQCSQRNIHFIDATPALQQAAAQGILPFNTIYDTHFNAEGHRIVGELLARALAP
jgi:hypothetical protein